MWSMRPVFLRVCFDSYLKIQGKGRIHRSGISGMNSHSDDVRFEPVDVAVTNVADTLTEHQTLISFSADPESLQHALSKNRFVQLSMTENADSLTCS
jgi:hypothetical protein